MFTGIIQEVGKMVALQKTKSGIKLSISAPKTAEKLKNGDSLAVNGVCLTVTKKNNKIITFDIIHETLSKTNLGNLRENSEVNLEPPLKVGDFLNGHMVLGHIDDAGTIQKINEKGEVEIKFPESLKKFITLKGCIAINGISLTISKLKANTLTIALTPFTFQKTNFRNMQKNDKVNLEIDMITRYMSHGA